MCSKNSSGRGHSVGVSHGARWASVEIQFNVQPRKPWEDFHPMTFDNRSICQRASAMVIPCTALIVKCWISRYTKHRRKWCVELTRFFFTFKQTSKSVRGFYFVQPPDGMKWSWFYIYPSFCWITRITWTTFDFVKSSHKVIWIQIHL